MSRYRFSGTTLMDTATGMAVMGDDAHSRERCAPLVEMARGRVLVFGLGIGLCVRLIQDLPQVDEVLVVELQQEIIDVAVPHAWFNSKVRVVQGDFWNFVAEPGRWDVAWCDIFASAEDFTDAAVSAVSERCRTMAPASGVWQPW